ncbi:NAD dependent epimerase/dehydratase family [Stigmatella aurantiaca DW4/3-1]|nr:NAD dependent epimerase/dehydratase family [Stigmatella aurantiaca DW4/3-1]
MTRDVDSPRARALAVSEVEPVAGDLADPSSYRDHLRDVDAVVHLTLDYGNPVSSDQGLFAELRAAHGRDGRHRHLVYTTGCSIYGKVEAPLLDENTPGNPEGSLFFRMRLEQELAASGLPHTVLRPGFMYGGDARTSMLGRWFAEAHAGRTAFYGNRDKSWSWIHIDDLAAAYVTVLARAGRSNLPREERVDGEIFCLGEEGPPTSLEIFTACLRTAGNTGPVSFEPIAAGGWLDQAADQDEVMNCAKARRQLGWSPRHGGVLPELATYHRAWRAASTAA